MEEIPPASPRPPAKRKTANRQRILDSDSDESGGEHTPLEAEGGNGQPRPTGDPVPAVTQPPPRPEQFNVQKVKQIGLRKAMQSRLEWTWEGRVMKWRGTSRTVDGIQFDLDIGKYGGLKVRRSSMNIG